MDTLYPLFCSFPPFFNTKKNDDTHWFVHLVASWAPGPFGQSLTQVQRGCGGNIWFRIHSPSTFQVAGIIIVASNKEALEDGFHGHLA